MKIVKVINALLYFIAVVMAFLSLLLKEPVIQKIYWVFFGCASILLLVTSIIESIRIYRRKQTERDGSVSEHQ